MRYLLLMLSAKDKHAQVTHLIVMSTSRRINEAEINDLYRRVGRCIWSIQFLEDVLHTHLTMKIDLREPGLVEAVEGYKHLAKHRRANLGTALNTAEKAAAISPALLSKLRLLKTERDWLVHRAMHEAGNSLDTEEGRLMLFVRLDALFERTQNLKNALVKETFAFCESHGIKS